MNKRKFQIKNDTRKSECTKQIIVIVKQKKITVKFQHFQQRQMGPSGWSYYRNILWWLCSFWTRCLNYTIFLCMNSPIFSYQRCEIQRCNCWSNRNTIQILDTRWPALMKNCEELLDWTHYWVIRMYTRPRVKETA